MLNENPNKDFHWKSKLDDLESLPGEIFNKDALWDRLHIRMQQKHGNKKAAWYWAAAACLLTALLIPLLFSKKNGNTIVKSNPAQQTIQTPATNVLPEGKKDSFGFITTIAAENKKPANLFENTEKMIAPANHKVLTFENVPVKKNKEELVEPVVIKEAVEPLGTNSNAVALVPGKKKLRVVHINELGEPADKPPAMTAQKTEHHSFQLKLANQEVFVNPSGAYTKTGFTILSSKNSPN
ncbi:MAG: hypothetical protein ABIR19_03690 [Ginsengibacter sp.]